MYFNVLHFIKMQKLKNNRTIVLTEAAKKKALTAIQLTEENNKKPRDEKLSMDVIAKMLNISRSTSYR